MRTCRLSVTILCVSVLGFLGTVARGAEHPASSASPAQVARARLTGAHQVLMSGLLAVETEQKRVAGRSSLAEATLATYRLQYQRHLSEVWSLEREWPSIRSIEDRDTVSDFLDQVVRVHLTALSLSSSFRSNGLTRARRLEAKEHGVDFAPTGAFACFGSIAGTVQGPSGPLAGVTVNAYTADGSPTGTTITLANGSYQIDDLLVGTDYYLVTTNSEDLIDEVYGDVPCPGSSCDPSIGTPVSVTVGNVTSGIDFILNEGGTISGTLLSLPGPSPLLSGVAIYDGDGNFIVSTLSDFITGEYQVDTGLASVPHYVVTTSFSDLLDELYDDIPCTGGALCDPQAGTAVDVVAGQNTPGINFTLEIGGRIAGNVIATGTGLPIPGMLVGIHDDTGSVFTYGQTDVFGDYLNLWGLGTGTYYATTSNVLGYRDELYQDLPCTGALCNITGGQGIDVVAGQETSDIDFSLEVGGKISGTVTHGVTGEPLEGVLILTWTTTGGRVDITQTNSVGEYITIRGLETADYYATTLNPFGFDDELYDDLPCPLGFCDVTPGTPIGVTLDQVTEDIDFDLEGGTLGSCDFEECTFCDLNSTS